MKKLLKIKNRIVLIISFLAFIIIAYLISARATHMTELKTITIGNKEIIIEIADTPQKQAKGLSGRKSLPQNQGMLFVFEKPDRHQFWMKDMLIPIDFVWINNNRVVEISKNISPTNYQPPKTIMPKEPIDAVLELNAGTAEIFDIKIGDKLDL